MDIKIVHVLRSGKTVPKLQLFNLSRGSKQFYGLSNDFTHLPLSKTKAKVQVNTIEEAISEYEKDFRYKVLNNIDFKKDILLSLYTKCEKLALKNKTIYLACYCKDDLLPQKQDHACHCDFIKKTLLVKWNRENS